MNNSKPQLLGSRCGQGGGWGGGSIGAQRCCRPIRQEFIFCSFINSHGGKAVKAAERGVCGVGGGGCSCSSSLMM